MYKQDLALNNLEGLICHKTQSMNLMESMIQLKIKLNFTKVTFFPVSYQACEN